MNEMNWILKLLLKAMCKHNQHVYRKPGHSWFDSYAYQDGYHVLVYHLSPTEPTAHEIAMDDNCNLLEE